MKAVVTSENKTAIVGHKDIPSIQKDEVLVKVIGVSLNPTDWKHVAYLAPPGVIVGCDYSGIVEKVGEDVKHVHVGDKVGGLVHGSKFEHTGAFAEHVAGIADVTWKKPDHISHEESATFGVGCLTAAASLYQKLELPPPSKPAQHPIPILIWSGATSVGQFAIQLAKLSNLTVITTASPKNHEWLKSLGADHCFDYRDPEVAQKIKQVTNNKLAYVLDCISEGTSQSLSAASIGADGGKIVTLLGVSELERKDVTFIRQLLYTAMGREFEMRGTKFPAAPQDRKFVVDFIRDDLNKLLADKKIKPNVIKLMDGGLDKLPEGLEYLKAGKASAEKLVYHVQDA